MEAVLWNEEAGAWLDYDLINERPRTNFVATNLSPLWMRCYNASRRDHIAEKVLQYIEKERLNDFPGGVPTTLCPSGKKNQFFKCL